MKKTTIFFVLLMNVGCYWLTQATPIYASGGAIRLVSPSGVDSGNCIVTPCATISYAHSQAANGDVIQLAAGTYTESGIVISKNITIVGAGRNNTIVQAHANANSASNRVFTINAGVSAAIDNVTIRHGKIVDSWSKGGGILNSGVLTVSNSTVYSNVVEHDPFDEFYLVSQGGGIYNTGSLFVISSTLDSNTTSKNMSSGEGGGIYNLGQLQVLSSTLSGNWSHYGAGMYNADMASALVTNAIFTRNLGSNVYYASGGGVYNAGVFTLTNSTVISQVFGATNAQGGGLFNTDTGMAYIDTTAFQSNTVGAGAGQLYGKGGAIYNAGGMTLQNSNLAYNQAGGSGNGGAIYNLGSSAYLTISNSILRNNAVGSTGDAGTGEGGAIYNGSNAVLRLATSQLLSNTASTSNKAAGLANANSATLSQTLIAYSTGRDCTGTISDAGYNASQDNTCGFGGPYIRYVATNGADTTNCLISLTPCRTVKYAVGQAVSNDKVKIAAGTYQEYDIDIINQTLTVVGNSATDTILDAGQNGRVIKFSCVTCHFVIESVTVRNGTGPSYGGGILIQSALSTQIMSSTISNNTSGAGGGIYKGGQGSLTLTNSQVTHNTADDYGGGISQGGDGNINIIGSAILSNTAISRFGGGIYHNNGDFTLTNSQVSYNKAQVNTESVGGGIYHGGTGNMTIITSEILSNTAKDGGGVYKGSGNNISLTNSKVSYNIARGYAGGIYHGGAGNITISSSLILSNTSNTSGGGGIYKGGLGSLTLTNSQVSYNTAQDYAGGISHAGTGNMIISSSLILSNTAISRFGGGIYHNSGDFMLTNSQVSYNKAQGNTESYGGGIYHEGAGAMNIITSLILGNISKNSGGGIYHSGNGSINITASSILSNTTIVGAGGGISQESSQAQLHLNNTTMSKNAAPAYGSAIASTTSNASNATITASTIYGNVGLSFAASHSIKSSIIQKCSGVSITDLGNNISTDNTCGLTQASSRNNVTNMLLLPLDNTGGFYMPSVFSLARDAYNAPCDTSTDQRGVARPINGKCDIGAVEGDLMPVRRTFVPNSRRRAASGW